MGISAGIGSFLWSCEQQVNKAIPYLVQPEETTTSRALHYASTFYKGGEYCPIVVKTVNGRPVKIEGNHLSETTKEGTSPRVQASILGLYDTDRIKEPTKNNSPISWKDLDSEIIGQLKKYASENEKIILLAEGIISPSTLQVINEFLNKYPNIEFLNLPPISLNAYYKAINECFGNVELQFNFEKTDLIVSLQNDFLGSWKSPIEFTRKYSDRRSNNDQGFQHIQLETNLSLTGSNADLRFPIQPSEENAILISIFNELNDDENKIIEPISSPSFNVSAIIEKLKNNKGRSLVLSGSNNFENQCLSLAINELLDNFENTISFCNSPDFNSFAGFQKVKKDIESGSLKGLILYHSNPVYKFPEEQFLQAIKKMDFSLSITNYNDESAQATKYCCPDHHFLESWNDYDFQGKETSFSQPVIHPLFKTRQGQDSLLKWVGSRQKYADFIRLNWKEKLGKTENDQAWLETIQDGVIKTENNKILKPNFNWRAIRNINYSIDNHNIEYIVYENSVIKDGSLSNNPWLQELPDPVTKSCWGNYASISHNFAKKNMLENGDEIVINSVLKLPVLIQPGHAENCLSIALGYGRKGIGEIANNLGENAFRLCSFNNTDTNFFGKAQIEKTNIKHHLPLSQLHSSLEGRDLVQEFSRENMLDKKREEEYVSFYIKPEFSGFHWGMAIDQNRCTGCSTCVLACQVENNIPVVGKNEMTRNHGMHWLRVDRYYSKDNKKVLFQPVMCQHCDAAPCENVCPVSATNHSKEGINQMVYNRCIGTRYCSNNCPYKTRRFNWLDYNKSDLTNNNEAVVSKMADPLPRLVLNPDVIVRSKGVIEKCSFCIQRIQEKKSLAKIENRKLGDQEIIPACVQACPSKAIVFGDMNDEKSKISGLIKSNRKYNLLGELNTMPSVHYLGRIRNENINNG